ncbi:hypothetical protein GCM10009837_61440 [Streptomyces durmitorensis]|uniref:PH domain-containing protein n=1 Tax=Streptomyces durmitorensis TaxID=319947 RepID=A0ABY4Q4C9_9ACTN|nr:hypothetical protein [Streptomyces durmitorensis]UQT60021.1 hypothetical protein M4V62_35955 [Streptomyces durmitorensis]
MARRTTRPARRTPGAPPERVPWTHDSAWAGDARSAAACSLLLLGLLLALDAAVGRLTGWRALLWLGLGVLLFAVLTPPRVAARDRTLVSRGPLRVRSVRLDQLIAVRRSDGISPRLTLRDAAGGEVVLDPEVLVVNPELWHLVSDGARASVARGSLLCGATALRRLSERIDRDTAEGVFRASGLE